jgi:hypothetical protein
MHADSRWATVVAVHFISRTGTWVQVRSYLQSEPESEAHSSAHWLADFAAQRAGSKDWRTSGLLVPPQNQGVCGSCWAFAGVHAVVDSLRIAHNINYSMVSIQQILCVDLPRSAGCGGGFHADVMYGMSVGFLNFVDLSRRSMCDTRWLNATDKANKCGVVVESCKPYAVYNDPDGVTLHCKDKRILATCTDGSPKFFADRPLPLLEDNGYNVLSGMGIAKMLAAIDKGPIAAGFLACDDWQNFGEDQSDYEGGIYYQWPPRDENRPFEGCGLHAVEIIGYGTYHSKLKAKAIDYWLVGTIRSRFSVRANFTAKSAYSCKLYTAPLHL